MRARVTRAYTDRLDGTVHLPGEDVDITDERAWELASKGFVDADAARAAGASAKAAPRRRAARKTRGA